MAWSDDLLQGTPAFTIASSANPRIRVVAGPGTGKSFAMKRRVARLLEGGVDPKRILPVTFTRVAAEDLHRELVGMKVTGCDALKGTTLHSLGMRILMRNAVLQTTGRTARPLNEFELEPLVCDLMGHGGKTKVRELKAAYESAWARLQQDEPGFQQTQGDADFANDLIAWLVFHNAMLIGEVIPELYRYLRDNPAAPERAEFTHILVDEFQDLNKAEQSVIKLLSDQAEVCIVGDDDQSIYSFKNAHPEGIRDWLVLHHGAEDVSLDECRRCPTKVAAMANSLIAHNKLRLVPRMLQPMPQNGPGEVYIVQFTNLQSEVAGIAQSVSWAMNKGHAPGDILVLAQSRAFGTPIYEELRASNIPVKSYYAEAELQNEEVQRRFSILKLFVDRQDKVALRWLIGLHGNNWNAAGYKRVREHCGKTGISPWQALEALANGQLSLPHTGNIVAAFKAVVEQLEVLELAGSLSVVIDTLFPDGDAAVIDLRKLALDALQEVGEEDRAAFMSALMDAIAQPDIPSEVKEVRIMSLHKSKGLSAPVTIIAGCVEGLLPKQPDASLPMDAIQASIEEQRRLFFVGISRVKADPSHGKPGTLILSSSLQMPLKNAMQANIKVAGSKYGQATLIASRFLQELGPEAPQSVKG